MNRDDILYGKFETCVLCEEPLNDPHQIAPFVTKGGIDKAHKSCLFQLTMDAWEEQIWRGKRNIPLNAPYDNKHIASPVVRKALQLDIDPETRLAQDYTEHGAVDALANMIDNDSDGFEELINRALNRG